MAIPIGISRLTGLGRAGSDLTEFMAEPEPSALLHTICAFANDIRNAGGGYIVLGAEPVPETHDIRISGIAPDSADAMLRMVSEISRLIIPFYEPKAETVMHEGKRLIVLRCKGGRGRPYTAPEDADAPESGRRCYVRKQGRSVPAAPHDENRLWLLSLGTPYDERPCIPAAPSDLDEELIRDCLRKSRSPLAGSSGEKTLRELSDDLDLLEGLPGEERPRNAAILMFGKDPQKYLPQAVIRLISVPDPGDGRITERTFSGTLPCQIRSALAHIRNALTEMVIKHSDRAEADRIWNFPYPAAEEILSFAVCFRSYEAAEPVDVRISGTEIRIRFPAGPAADSADGEAGGSLTGNIPENRRIPELMREMGFDAAWKSGFPGAAAALRHNGSPPLRIMTDTGRSSLTVIIPVHRKFLTEAIKRDARYQERILSALGSGSLPLTEISAAMGYRGISKKLSDTVRAMTDGGTLQQFTGPQRRLLYRKI